MFTAWYTAEGNVCTQDWIGQHALDHFAKVATPERPHRWRLKGPNGIVESWQPLRLLQNLTMALWHYEILQQTGNVNAYQAPTFQNGDFRKVLSRNVKWQGQLPNSARCNERTQCGAYWQLDQSRRLLSSGSPCEQPNSSLKELNRPWLDGPI